MQRVGLFERVSKVPLWPTICYNFYVWRSRWRSIINILFSHFILGAPSKTKGRQFLAQNRNLGREVRIWRCKRQKPRKGHAHFRRRAIRLMEYHRPVLSSIPRSLQRSFKHPQCWDVMRRNSFDGTVYYVDQSARLNEIIYCAFS